MQRDSRKIFREVILKWMPNPEVPAQEDCWSPDIEKAAPEKIKEIQSEKLEAAFRYIYEYSPFFRQKYKQAGLTPRDIKSIDDLHKIPITDKNDLKMSIQENPPWGNFSCIDDLWKKDGWIVFLTTGSTGGPVPCRFTHFDRKTQSWMLARQWLMTGVTSNDFVMYCVPFSTHIYTWIHYCAQEVSKIPMISAGAPLSTDGRIDYLLKYQPTILVGTPSYMIYMGEVMKEKGLNPSRTSVRAIVVAGEPGGSVLSSRKRIMSLWGAPVCDLFGSTESGAVGGHAIMCKHEMMDHGRNPYLHYMEDAGIPEVVDPETSELLPEGEYGSFVWSGISSISQPMLRFNLNDMVNIKSTQCQCGRTLRVSEGGIIGRTDDMILLRGVNIFPSNIEEAVRSMEELGNEYRLKIVEDEKGMADLIVEIEIQPEIHKKDYGSVLKKLQVNIENICQVRVSAESVPFGSLPRSEFKTKRVIDLRKKNQE